MPAEGACSKDTRRILRSFYVALGPSGLFCFRGLRVMLLFHSKDTATIHAMLSHVDVGGFSWCLFRALG